MKNLYDLKFEELLDYLTNNGIEQYRTKQIFIWLHKNNIKHLYEMTNIKKDLIDKLSNDFDFSIPKIEQKFISKIDGTIKYLIRLIDDSLIESVLMKYKYGYSLCISSQVGCNMNCIFCASTKAGLKRNLTISELLWQVYLIDADLNFIYHKNISHIVIMGSGEPLNNYDNLIAFLNIINSSLGKNISMRNITISTCGIVDNIKKLADLKLQLTLALSLHAPTDDIRKKIMPIANKYDIYNVIKSMQYYFKQTKRKITFEYILIKNINSSKDCAKKLCLLLLDFFRNYEFNINIIPINEIKEIDFKRPSSFDIKMFTDVLDYYKIFYTIRRELGADISGSCGQLRAKYLI